MFLRVYSRAIRGFFVLDCAGYAIAIFSGVINSSHVRAYGSFSLFVSTCEGLYLVSMVGGFVRTGSQLRKSVYGTASAFRVSLRLVYLGCGLLIVKGYLGLTSTALANGFTLKLGSMQE